MKFFVPQATPKTYQDVYQEMAKSVKDQMKIPLTDRKIFSITYTHDKKKLHAEVGKPEPQQGRYQVMAIFESKPHVIFTRSNTGGPGLTILVTNEEITKVVDFD